MLKQLAVSVGIMQLRLLNGKKSQVLLICVMQILGSMSIDAIQTHILLFGKLCSLPSANGLIAIFDCMCLFLVQHVVKRK